MPRNDKRSEVYNFLKERGWVPEKPYAQYSAEELSEIATLYGAVGRHPSNARKAREVPEYDDEVVRVDEQGREWLQEEVRKPAYPKPRGRRVLTYVDPGVRQETVQQSDGYIESFEVPGDRKNRTAEIKITLPSFQVGIYRDRRFPFRIHVYNGREGFNLYDVENFYGGAQLVPSECKRIYIENDLCYDIRSVVQAIRSEHRQMILQKGTAR